MNGFFFIDKREDWTSRDVVTKISHLFHSKKVGHNGTLDPFATGLLIVAIGNGTKASTYVEDFDKEYVAELKLGSSTSTGDKQGEIVEEKDIPNLSIDQIKSALISFLGIQNQIPPKYSAVHVNGVKAYKLMYRGQDINENDIKPRQIEIKEIELISFKDNVIKFRCLVSKGTYIRVLGEDIAKKLNTVGHLISLRRTKLGPYLVSQGKDVLAINENDLVSIYNMLNYLPIVYVKDDDLTKVKNGVSFSKEISLNHDRILMADEEHNALAIYELKDDKFICKRGLW